MVIIIYNAENDAKYKRKVILCIGRWLAKIGKSTTVINNNARWKTHSDFSEKVQYSDLIKVRAHIE